MGKTFEEVGDGEWRVPPFWTEVHMGVPSPGGAKTSFGGQTLGMQNVNDGGCE